MHLVLGEILFSHRLEGTGTHMQRHESFLHAHVAQIFKKLLGKMQARGRRCNGPRILGVHRLIAAFVGSLSIALDIGRQRHLAHGIENGQRRRIECQLEEFPLTSAHNGFIGNPVFTRENQAGTGLGLFARAQHADDGVFARHAFDHGFNGAARLLDATQTSLDHARVIHHEQITGAKQMLEIRKNKVFDHVVAHMQQAGSRTFGKRKLSDQFKREIEVIVGQMLSVEVGRM